jgi:hypothetical protein
MTYVELDAATRVACRAECVDDNPIAASWNAF